MDTAETETQSEPDTADTEPQAEGEEGNDAVKPEETQQEAEESNDDLTWAKALGVDDSMIVLDDDGNFKGVKVQVDGEPEVVDLKTALEGFRFNRHNTQTSQKLAEEKKQLEAIRQASFSELNQKFTEAAKLTEYLDSKLLGEFNIDWQHLRATDPAEYAARVQDYQLKQAEIQQLKGAIGQELEQQQAILQQQQAAQMQAYVQDQLQQLLTDVPEWQDKAKMTADFDAMASIAESYGFSRSEFDNVMDARMIKVLKDAMAYRNGKTVAEKKLEKPLPKFIKSTNTAPSKATSKLDKLVKASQKAEGYNKSKLQDAAINELLSGLNIR